MMTAQLLGFADYQVGRLWSAGMLPALGNPTKNAPKHYARVLIMKLYEDVAWLNKATALLQKKNAKRRRK